MANEKSKLLDQLKYDVRLTEYNLNTGALTQDELKKHLQSLPDCADKVTPMTLEDRDDSTTH